MIKKIQDSRPSDCVGRSNVHTITPSSTSLVVIRKGGMPFVIFMIPKMRNTPQLQLVSPGIQRKEFNMKYTWRLKIELTSNFTWHRQKPQCLDEFIFTMQSSSLLFLSRLDETCMSLQTSTTVVVILSELASRNKSLASELNDVMMQRLHFWHGASYS